jgi:hypothetical protein
MYRPMEPLDPDASPWDRRGRSCVIHYWGPCPNWVTQVHGSSSSGRQGEAEGEQEEDEAHRISVVTDLVEAQVIHQTVMISIGSRG